MLRVLRAAGWAVVILAGPIAAAYTSLYLATFILLLLLLLLLRRVGLPTWWAFGVLLPFAAIIPVVAVSWRLAAPQEVA